jgi:hypothetical protein
MSRKTTTAPAAVCVAGEIAQLCALTDAAHHRADCDASQAALHTKAHTEASRRESELMDAVYSLQDQATYVPALSATGALFQLGIAASDFDAIHSGSFACDAERGRAVRRVVRVLYSIASYLESTGAALPGELRQAYLSPALDPHAIRTDAVAAIGRD